MPANLLQPCDDLVSPEGEQVGDLVVWGVDASSQYRVCKQKHKALSEAVGGKI